MQLLGQPISVGRPSGYVDPTAAQQAAAAAAAALEQFQASALHTLRCGGPHCYSMQRHLGTLVLLLHAVSEGGR